MIRVKGAGCAICDHDGNAKLAEAGIYSTDAGRGRLLRHVTILTLYCVVLADLTVPGLGRSAFLITAEQNGDFLFPIFQVQGTDIKLV